jgi:oligopeptide/dipeptide ABC transporter ATP-binding protein
MNRVPLLHVDGLVCHFPVRNDWGVRVGWLKALDGVSFDIAQGEVLGVVGESGCGKSTLGKTLVGIHKQNSGELKFEGNHLSKLSRQEEKHLRTRLQYCYQDPGASLDPRWKIGRSLEEPLVIHTNLSKEERRLRVREVLAPVGLPETIIDQYPHEISGGQQRRVGIARVLMLRPNLIILDEPTSGLDVSVQAAVLNLLADLRKRYNLAYLLISHDLAVVRKVSNRIAVMYLGKIVEMGPSIEIFRAPVHPYTQLLLASAPRIGKERITDTLIVNGEPPRPTDALHGCSFAPRCTKVQAVCRTTEPFLKLAGNFTEVACHFSTSTGANHPNSAT